MRSKYKTLLSLTEFFEQMGLNRWLGAQISQYQDVDTNLLKPVTFDVRLKKGCYDVWFEELYINQQVSRDDVSYAIMLAEQQFRNVMGFHPAPVAKTEEVDYEGFYDHLRWTQNGMFDVHQQPKCFPVENKQVIELGIYVWDFIDYYTGTLEDLNNDKVQETILIEDVIVPIGTECHQLEVYFVADDYPYGGIENNTTPEQEWKVYPIQAHVTSADNDDDTMTYQIRFFAYQGVKPNLQMTEFPKELVANVEANFSLTYRVFVRSVDSETQGYLRFKDNCTWADTEDCFLLDTNNDLVCPSPSGDGLVCSHGNKPDKFVVNYISGCERQSCGRMEEVCAAMVALLAAANLDCPPCGCGCEGKKHPLAFYSELYKEEVNGETYLGDSLRDRQNPFGPKNGQVMAWRLAKYLSEKGIHVVLP